VKAGWQSNLGECALSMRTQGKLANFLQTWRTYQELNRRAFDLWLIAENFQAAFRYPPKAIKALSLLKSMHFQAEHEGGADVGDSS
jgi:hypothetical protein